MEGALSPELAAKYDRLRSLLAEMGSALLAFSGGVDSALVLKVGHDVLGPRLLAVTGRSPAVPPEEIEAAAALARQVGARHVVIDTEEMATEGYVRNAPDRCYFCKHELYTKLTALARQEGIRTLLDGTNRDDVGDFRPGLQAAAELSVRSPLKEAGLGKEEVRALSRWLGLPTWDKPASPCLASRIAYGIRVTPEALARIWQAESFLRSLGLQVLRVRYHEQIARIEVPEAELATVLAHRQAIVARLKELGFQYVTLDLAGFRSGSLNEVLRRSAAGASA